MSSPEIDINNLLTSCEREPIHIPGLVQPFGMLLTLEPASLEIQNVSENCLQHWGVMAAAVLGQSLSTWLNEGDISVLLQYLSHPAVEEQNPLPVNLPLNGGQMRGTWELTAHRHEEVLILELFAVANRTIKAGALPFHRKIRDAVQALQHASTLQQLCNCAVQEVKRITGFGRVMIYRFDEDWHGVVVAEECDEGLDSYLGHHFPASDIPAQARKVFLQNGLRMIPDVNYVPSAIHPNRHPVTGHPLDLSKSMLRSVSPIHLEYLRNMDVNATLTISLLDEGKLWGLIACHHPDPLFLGADDRLGAHLVGQIVSSQLRVKESLEDLAYREELKGIYGALLSRMEKETDLVKGLVQHSPNMLDVAGAHGAAAAIYYDGQWTLLGNTPDMAQIEELVSWLGEQHPNKGLFHTSCLPHIYPPADAYREIASGILAVLIPKTKRSYLLWFRPEVATTVTWAGKPDKSVVVSGDKLQLHPRKSFSSWNEIVTGKALPWKKVELEAVVELRNSILALDLERQFNKEQAARSLAEKLSREKEDMVMAVSHDLKAPLAVAKMSFELLDIDMSNFGDDVQGLVNRGMRATNAMEELVTDILDIAKIESGNIELDLKPERVDDLVEEIAELFAPLAQNKGVNFKRVLASSECQAYCERGRLRQVLANLVGNAIKFTPPQGSVTVKIEQCTPEEVTFSVADTGPGIAPINLLRIFDRFWQAKQTKRMGTGLGLAIAKGIVDMHNGKIWADSIEGVGSKFYFSIPRHPAPLEA